MPTVSIDSGSSFLKFFDGSRKGIFPALLERVMEGTPKQDTVTVAGKCYLVGESAALAKTQYDPDPYIERGFHGSQEQYVQMCYALQQLDADGTLDTLVCSLPYKESAADETRRAITQRTQFEWYDPTGRVRNVRFRDVFVTAQGVGALFLYHHQFGKKVGAATLVDIGSCTVDVVTIRWDVKRNDYVVVDKASDSDRSVSVASFKNAWLERIKKIDGLQQRDFGYYQLMNRPIERNFVVPHCGDQVDLEPSFLATQQDFTHKIAKSVRDKVQSMWAELEVIILTGGGAELLDLGLWGDRRLTKLDTYANVLGQHLVASSEQSVSRAA